MQRPVCCTTVSQLEYRISPSPSPSLFREREKRRGESEREARAGIEEGWTRMEGKERRRVVPVS